MQHQLVNPANDLEERLSYISGTKAADDKNNEYADMKTPTDLEDGALVPGGALNLFSREAFALFCQYGSIGIIYGMIPALEYPIFNNYLQLEGYQTASYGTLVTLGWSFKAFMGMLSDCFPIFGFRRKSWMLIGWTVAMICLLIMSFSSLGDPYCNKQKAKGINSTACSTPWSKVPEDEKWLFNRSAPDNGSMFIILSIFVSLGYVTAACASDGMVVQYSQREPEAIRGRVLTAIYTVRDTCNAISNLFVAICLNDANYGGSFKFAVSPNVPYMVCIVPCVLAMLSTLFILVEDKKPAVPFKEYITKFWNLLQNRVMWQICAFRLISNFFQRISTTAVTPLKSNWVKAETFNNSIADTISVVISVSIYVLIGKYGLHWNWRWAIALATISIVVMDSIIVFFTVWDVVRDQWFYLGTGLVENVPGGVRFIVSTYCAVEIADQGNEGATYGLLTTLSNLTGPFSTQVYKFIDSYFRLSQDDLKEDSTEVRWDVTYSYFVSYGSKLFALVWLFMLPPQRGPMQELKKKGGKSKLAAIIILVVFFFCLTFSVATNILSIFPSTKCYRIAGGNGKLDPKTGKCPLTTRNH